MKRAVVIIALAALPAFADEVHLKGGGRMTGEIIEQTDDHVTVDIGGAFLTAKMTSVVKIERTMSPLQDYRARAAAIAAGDTEAWRELARWATSWTLSSQAKEAWEQVLVALPEDEEANRAIGRVQLNGRWVTEQESYLARGYIEFEHQWMLPAEKQTILAERRAQEETARQENQAAIQAIETEQAADRERERQEAEERAKKFNSLPQLGDPIPWAWGTGPAYWPVSGSAPE